MQLRYEIEIDRRWLEAASEPGMAWSWLMANKLARSPPPPCCSALGSDTRLVCTHPVTHALVGMMIHAVLQLAASTSQWWSNWRDVSKEPK